MLSINGYSWHLLSDYSAAPNKKDGHCTVAVSLPGVLFGAPPIWKFQNGANLKYNIYIWIKKKLLYIQSVIIYSVCVQCSSTYIHTRRHPLR